MRKNYLMNGVLCGLLLTIVVCSFLASASESETVSGELNSGYRVLTVPAEGYEIHYTVYRGDYIQFDVGETREEVLLSIPTLAIRQSVTAVGTGREAPYFKMKELGSYPFTLGELRGVIEVVEFDRPQYAVLSADEAAQLIANISPVILDVRTAQEYSTGHLKNAILIPLQELQQRYPELNDYKNEDVFIYCATGNRSTVAAKILIDNGFTRIHNLRYGILDWAKNGYPVSR